MGDKEAELAAYFATTTTATATATAAATATTAAATFLGRLGIFFLDWGLWGLVCGLVCGLVFVFIIIWCALVSLASLQERKVVTNVGYCRLKLLRIATIS